MEPILNSAPVSPEVLQNMPVTKNNTLPWIFGALAFLAAAGVGAWYFVLGGFFSVPEDVSKITCGEVTIEAERSVLVLPRAALKGNKSTHAYSNITFTVRGKTLLAQHNAESSSYDVALDMRSDNSFPPGGVIDRAYILDMDRFRQTEDQVFGSIIKSVDNEGTDFFVFSRSALSSEDFETAVQCLSANKAKLEEATNKTIMGAALLIEGTKLEKISTYIKEPVSGRGMAFVCPAGPSLRLSQGYIQTTTEPNSPISTETEETQSVGFTSLLGTFYPIPNGQGGEVDPKLKNVESWSECKNAAGQNIGDYIKELGSKVTVLDS